MAQCKYEKGQWASSKLPPSISYIGLHWGGLVASHLCFPKGWMAYIGTFWRPWEMVVFGKVFWSLSFVVEKFRAFFGKVIWIKACYISPFRKMREIFQLRMINAWTNIEFWVKTQLHNQLEIIKCKYLWGQRESCWYNFLIIITFIHRVHRSF